MMSKRVQQMQRDCSKPMSQLNWQGEKIKKPVNTHEPPSILLTSYSTREPLHFGRQHFARKQLKLNCGGVIKVNGRRALPVAVARASRRALSPLAVLNLLTSPDGGHGPNRK